MTSPEKAVMSSEPTPEQIKQWRNEWDNVDSLKPEHRQLTASNYLAIRAYQAGLQASRSAPAVKDAMPGAEGMRAALEEVVRVIERGSPAITDTIWVSDGTSETLLDHCLAALEKASPAVPAGEPVAAVSPEILKRIGLPFWLAKQWARHDFDPDSDEELYDFIANKTVEYIKNDLETLAPIVQGVAQARPSGAVPVDIEAWLSKHQLPHRFYDEDADQDVLLVRADDVREFLAGVNG
jgi:hypothetical protein